ncbi:hypothetical protein [Oleidesulfovibrio alaskensis]|jgi:hypothetical protein|nr:hypothetical protein [Oleidesulfovibrio alaskensis]MBG0773107.1 hypothetical protein [Oleidesulfovibrio alaskensis]
MINVAPFISFDKVRVHFASLCWRTTMFETAPEKIRLAVVVYTPDGKRIEVEAAVGGRLYVDVEEESRCTEHFAVHWEELPQEQQLLAGELIEAVTHHVTVFGNSCAPCVKKKTR